MPLRADVLVGPPDRPPAVKRAWVRDGDLQSTVGVGQLDEEQIEITTDLVVGMLIDLFPKESHLAVGDAITKAVAHHLWE